MTRLLPILCLFFAIPSSQAAEPDLYKYAGLPPLEAAKAMTVPPGFSVSLFAGEPDVKQPIAFCFDDRGRLWVAEAYSYPKRQPEGQGKDRILIFEDSKGTGHFDKRTVFMEGLNLVSGLAYGFGGIYVGAAPQFLFIPIKDGEDKPAGPPQVLLDGWGYQDTHETLNTFVWGPDGWLYGCHGVFTHSKVGKPGTPDAERIPINAGIWRYHPTRHEFEVFAHGTSNPWGLDFNKYGQFFIEACVIPHNWHIIQGGRYARQAGSHFNPYTYGEIQTIAQHRHYVGNQWNNTDRIGSDGAGGGHAHAGAMIYQGGAWPKEYDGQMFMANLHGHRINIDTLTPNGSGYTASYHPDFLFTHDKYSMFVNIQSGPDGSAYAIDWYDRQTCHNNSPDIWDRTNGRIYKISYEGTKPVVGLDLAKEPDEKLVEELKSDNCWFARHAERLLQERAAAGKFGSNTKAILAQMATQSPDEIHRLHGLWTLHACGGLTPDQIRTALADKSPVVRAWTVQLALEKPPYDPKLLKDIQAYANTPFSAPVERLALASALQRWPLKDRWNTAKPLLRYEENADDINLPYLIWYGIEPLAELSPAKALDLTMKGKIPLVHQFMVRRIASIGTPEALEVLANEAGQLVFPQDQLDILRGMQEGLKGRRGVKAPKNWKDAAAKLAKSSPEVALQSQLLAVKFGDEEVGKDLLRTVFLDPKRDRNDRMRVLVALQDANHPAVPAALRTVLNNDRELRGAALRGLAGYADEATPQAIMGVWSELSATERSDALNTLASRPAYALALLKFVEDKRIPVNQVPAEVIRNLRNLKSPELNAKVEAVWGIVRNSPQDKINLISQYNKRLSNESKEPNLPLGRAVFSKVCAQCHTLYGIGGKVGPDITGSNRGNLSYLLENILDPSAVIPKEYAASVIQLSSGRSITGIIKSETPTALTVQTANEMLTIPVGDIETRKTSAVSMMPEDLLKPLSDAETSALIAYLRHPKQTPILGTPENAKDFFNGKDLTGWQGTEGLWRVENGEIVGSTPGLKKNTFLTSQMTVSDFKLSLKLKLTPNKENSGVQFRSELLPDGEMRGPQADVGAGWWGKLYEESARGLLVKEGGEKYVKPDDWNEYVIEAKGNHIRTWINGNLCVDLTDDKVSKKGIFGLQMHAGGKMEVRFKDLNLEVYK